MLQIGIILSYVIVVVSVVLTVTFDGEFSTPVE